MFGALVRNFNPMTIFCHYFGEIFDLKGFSAFLRRWKKYQIWSNQAFVENCVDTSSLIERQKNNKKCIFGHRRKKGQNLLVKLTFRSRDQFKSKQHFLSSLKTPEHCWKMSLIDHWSELWFSSVWWRLNKHSSVNIFILLNMQLFNTRFDNFGFK